MRRIPTLLLFALVLTVTACPRKTAIWVVGQEAPGRPVFGVGEAYHGRPTWLGVLIVAPCADFDGTARKAAWFLVQRAEPRAVARITYGRVPAGYAATAYMATEQSTTAVAPPLSAGCYVAKTDGTGRVRFNVAADGSVLEQPGDQ